MSLIEGRTARLGVVLFVCSQIPNILLQTFGLTGAFARTMYVAMVFISQLIGQKSLICCKFRFDFDAFVIPFPVGYTEQGITCAGHTRVAKYE